MKTVDCGPMILRLAVIALVPLLTAFSTPEEARKAMVGEWQGTASDTALKVTNRDDRAVFVDGYGTVEGPLVIQEVVGKTIRFRIGDQRFNMFFTIPTKFLPETRTSVSRDGRIPQVIKKVR